MVRSVIDDITHIVTEDGTIIEREKAGTYKKEDKLKRLFRKMIINTHEDSVI